MTGTASEVMRLFGIVLILGNLFALAAGVALLLAPHKVITWLGLRTQHPLSVRRLTKVLDVPRNSDKVMLRYPRVLGAALLASGIFILVKGGLFVSTLSLVEGGRALALLFPGAAIPRVLWKSFWVVTMGVILFGALLAVLVGLLALLRVQTLKKLSSVADRWISTRRVIKPASRPYYGIDRFVATHPQALGGVIALLAIYTLGMIVWFNRSVVL